MKLEIGVFCCLMIGNVLFSETNEKLLSGFLENDLQLKKYVVTAESKSLSFDKTKIDNGINVNLSSGEMKISTSQDKTKITVTPNASVNIPQINDLTISTSLPLTIEDNKTELQNGKLSASIGIISNAKKKRQVNLLEAERTLLQANRNVQNRSISAEKEYYSNLKSLYNKAISVLNARADFYDDSTDLKVLQVQGYSKNSASYRQKNLKVESDKRNVIEKEKIFEREAMIFARKCGIDLNINFDEKSELIYKKLVAFLPNEIPYNSSKEENVFDYDKNLYTKTEQALWEQNIGELKREADKDLSIKFTGEYVFNDSFYSEADSVGGKLTLGFRGINASAGAYFPINESNDESYNPYYSFSISLIPNDWKLSKINKQQNELDKKLEILNIESASNDYETDLLDKTTTFQDLKWSEISCKEELETYTILERDMSNWLKQGIVTENDYLDAVNNKEKARINVLINKIDLLMFNSDVKLMFVNDSNKTE